MNNQMDMFSYLENQTDANFSRSICDINDEDILEIINSLIDDEYLDGGCLKIQKNKTPPNSIIFSAYPSSYRENIGDQVICWVKTSGKEDLRYVMISDAYRIKIVDLNIPFTSIESNPSPRISIDVFIKFCEEQPDEARILFRSILDSSFSFERFDCCSRYKECSRQSKCIHPDKIYSTACTYRKRLKAGKNFYI